MKEGFLIIQCGYEGIESLKFLTDKSDDALAELKLIYKDIDERNELRSKYTEDEIYKLEDDDLYDKIAHIEDKNAFCIQRWNGKTFECHCKELGIENKNIWLY